MKVIYRNKSYQVNYKRKSSLPKVQQSTVISSIAADDDEPDGSLEQIEPSLTTESDYEDSFQSESGTGRPGSEEEELEHLSAGEEEELDEDDHTRTINGIVLEYLEFLGLNDTFSTFKTECSRKEIPLPTVVRNRPCSAQSEVDTFFEAFDNWDAAGMIETWSKFCDEEERAGKTNFRQASILLRIHLASLPFRKDEDAEAKYGALEELREFHQTYSEEFTKDAVCLPLFAFPFVENPDEHPAFREIFTDEWQQNLRQQLQVLLSNHMEAIAGRRPDTCALKDMYDYFLDESTEDNGEKRVENAVNEVSPTGSYGDNSLAFDSICPEVSSYVKQSLRQTQERYCKLLNATTAVVCALEGAVQGKAQNIRVLESRLESSFPELFGTKSQKSRVDIKSFVPFLPSVQNMTTTVTIGNETVKDTESMTVETQDDTIEPTVDDEEAETNDEWTEDEFSDVDTDAAPAIDDSESSTSVCATQRSSVPNLPIGSKTSSGRLHGSQNVSARSSLISHRSRKSEVTGGNAQEGGDTVVTLKLTDSKANTRILENADEMAEHEDQEVPEGFCEYFAGITPRKPVHQVVKPAEPLPKLNSNLMPPTLSNRFPTPPKTYTVDSSTNLTVMYIPSSLEVGCSGLSSNAPTGRDTPERSIKSLSRLSSRGQVSGEEEERSRSPSPTPAKAVDVADAIEEPKTRKKWEPDPVRISQHLLPHHVTQDTQLLGTRVLTPPPEKKTAMASLMDVNNCSTQSSPCKSQITSFKRLHHVVNVVNDVGKYSTTARPTPAVGTGAQYLNRKISSKGGVVPHKKYSSEGQGYGYPGRVYKINHKGKEDDTVVVARGGVFKPTNFRY